MLRLPFRVAAPCLAVALIASNGSCSLAANSSSPSASPVQAPDPKTLREDGWNRGAWNNMNPGAGGNIQSIALDPNTPNRMWFCSDMEGHYRSDDGGLSWHYKGADLSFSYVNTVSVEPGDAQRCYTGTVGGLEVSNDAGDGWKRVDAIKDSIGQIAINPTDPAQVFALPGKRHRWVDDIPEARGPLGRRDFYLSSDRGKTWKTVAYDAQSGRRDILSFDFDARSSTTCVLGALAGVYRSGDGGQSWRKLSAPANTGDCLGAALSPDGKRLYATYRVASNGEAAIVTSATGDLEARGQSHLFVARNDGLAPNWTDLSQNAPGLQLKADETALFWRPRPDPRGAGATQRLLVGVVRPQNGVWQADVTEQNGTFRARWTKVLGYDIRAVVPHFDCVPFDTGWEHWGIMGEDYGFAPLGWKGASAGFVYATGGQTLWTTDLLKPTFATDWQPRYTRLVSAQTVQTSDGPLLMRFYRTRGAQCTFVFDADAWQNYVAQGNADNGLLESYDGGYSFTGDNKPGGYLNSRCNTVRILRGLKTPLVVAHMATGWGADNWKPTNALWAKRLDTRSPRDRWVQIAGGASHLAGFGDDEFSAIAQDPKNPKRLAVGLRFSDLVIIPDVEALYNAAVAGQPLPSAIKPLRLALPPKPQGVSVTGTGLAFDPNDANILWVSGPEALWKGTRGQNDSDWTWRKAMSGQSLGFTLASVNGQTLVAVGQAGQGDDVLALSRDGGQTFRRVVSFESVKPLRHPAWVRDGVKMHLGGLTSDAQGRLYFTYQTALDQGIKPFGLFRATLSGNTAKVEDFSADCPFPYPVRSRVVGTGSGENLILCTRGNGLWSRSLSK